MPAFRDTWALTLHRLGRHREAVDEQQRAIAQLQDDAQREAYELRLLRYELALTESTFKPTRAAEPGGAPDSEP